MRISLLVLFSVFSLFAGAQKYQPIDSTIIWSTEEVGKNLSSCYVKSVCKYYFKGYELNNTRTWSKVYTSYYSYGVSFPQCTTYTPPPTVYNVPFGYVFDDTLNRKVYFRYNLPSNYTPVTNDIVYDFNNKNVGDTIYTFPIMSSSYRFGVDAIDSILFSGKYHKRYLTTISPSNLWLSPYKVTFTEGIGSSIGAFTYSLNPMGEQLSNLMCFASPTQTMSITNHSVYTNGGSCNNIALGITEKDIIAEGIFPNPASDHFVILKGDDNREAITFMIYNSLGQLQLSGTVTGQTQKINTEALSNGVYFVRLSSGSKSDTKKLLIRKE